MNQIFVCVLDGSTKKSNILSKKNNLDTFFKCSCDIFICVIHAHMVVTISQQNQSRRQYYSSILIGRFATCIIISSTIHVPPSHIMFLYQFQLLKLVAWALEQILADVLAVDKWYGNGFVTSNSSYIGENLEKKLILCLHWILIL